MAHKVLTIFIINLIILSITSKISAFKLQMYPINNPQFKILSPHFDEQETDQFLVNLTMSRTLDLGTNSSRYDPKTIGIRVLKGKTNFYVTRLNIGSGGGQVAYVLLDTQSDETWVQCEGCDPCIDLSPNAANFSYKSSASFKAMNIDDPFCKPPLQYQGSCGYQVVYSQSSTQGFVGKDTFVFYNPITKFRESFPDLAFGCGLHNKDFTFGTKKEKTNLISGVHGLAPGPRSFLTQLDQQIKGRFAYCLVPWYEGGTGESAMSFGDDAQIGGDVVQTITMRSERRYHLNMQGISVDGERLTIDPAVFALDPISYSKGFFIDTGAAFTKLVRDAFDPLKDAVIEYFQKKYSFEPLEPGKYVFDLCYSQYPDEVPGFPTVVFHFGSDGKGGEVDMPLSKDNIFRKVRDGFCMLIMPNPEGVEYNLFGAFQQTNFKFLYEVKKGQLSFVPQRCLTTG